MASFSMCLTLTLTILCVICNAFTKICDQVYECANNVIDCNQNEDCNIECNGIASCMGSIINCPSDYECSVWCTAESSCQQTIFNASKSSEFILLDCLHGDYTCNGITVYCPDDQLNDKNCIIYGDDSLSSMDNNPINFYSINGWKNIDMNGYNGSYQHITGTIHCGPDYSISCNFQDNWSCLKGTDQCPMSTMIDADSTWNDDYKLLNPSSSTQQGWIVNDFENKPANTITYGDFNIYHGPFTGDDVSGSIDIYTMTQFFYCSYDSSVDIEYYFGFSCSEQADYLSLYIDDILINKNNANKNGPQSQNFLDPLLEKSVTSICPDSWKHISPITATIPFVAINQPFKMKFEFGVNLNNDVLVLTQLNITCNKITASPTYEPTTNPTRDPTYEPTTVPSTEPTAEPTTEPTAEPTTLEPTLRDIISSTNDNDVGSKDVDSDSLEILLNAEDDDDKDGIIAAMVIIITAFIVVIGIVCRYYRNHENEYGHVFKKRVNEMMKISETKFEPQINTHGITLNNHHYLKSISL